MQTTRDKYVAVALLTALIIIIVVKDYRREKSYEKLNNKLTACEVDRARLSALYERKGSHESFASQREKSDTIFEWFKVRQPPYTYDKYRRDLKRKSNIVEYERARELAEKNKLTRDAVDAIVGI